MSPLETVIHFYNNPTVPLGTFFQGLEYGFLPSPMLKSQTSFFFNVGVFEYAWLYMYVQVCVVSVEAPGQTQVSCSEMWFTPFETGFLTGLVLTD